MVEANILRQQAMIGLYSSMSLAGVREPAEGKMRTILGPVVARETTQDKAK